MKRYENPASLRFLLAVCSITLHCAAGIAGGGGEFAVWVCFSEMVLDSFPQVEFWTQDSAYFFSFTLHSPGFFSFDCMNW